MVRILSTDQCRWLSVVAVGPSSGWKTNASYRIWSSHCCGPYIRMSYKDVRPEQRTPSYAGSSSVMDFLLRDDGVAVEVKATRPGRSEPPGFPGHDRTYYEANKAIVDQAVETALFL